MRHLACLSLLIILSAPNSNAAESIGKWQRFSVSLDNPTWEGNPFDVECSGEFTSPSGRTLKQWGFYAGDGQWRIYFMPDETGKWTFKTHSPDPDLDGKSGIFDCKKSGLPGKLEANGNHWRLSDAGGDAPVIWNPPTSDGAHWAFRSRSADDPTVTNAIDFAADVVGARVLGLYDLVTVPTGWAKDWPQDSVPYVIGKEGNEFYLPFWDRLNDKLDAVRDRGMGHYVMIYSDDELTPDHFGITPGSPAEIRLFKYSVARLGCYPIVLWDTGIDISEYRNQEWTNGFAQWFTANDPWQHPVGSRSGGGSGGKLPPAATYFSTGGANLPTRAELLDYLKVKVPTAHTDHWRPYIRRGDWTHDKIRTAIWRCTLTGGQASFPDYNQGPVDQEGVQIGGAYIGHATHFFRKEVKSDLRELAPHDELITAGENAILAANPGKEYVLYDLDGGDVTLDLSAAKGTLKARWYNPRTGKMETQKKVQANAKAMLSAPGNGPGEDWVLHLYP